MDENLSNYDFNMKYYGESFGESPTGTRTMMPMPMSYMPIPSVGGRMFGGGADDGAALRMLMGQLDNSVASRTPQPVAFPSQTQDQAFKEAYSGPAGDAPMSRKMHDKDERTASPEGAGNLGLAANLPAGVRSALDWFRRGRGVGLGSNLGPAAPAQPDLDRAALVAMMRK